MARTGHGRLLDGGSSHARSDFVELSGLVHIARNGTQFDILALRDVVVTEIRVGHSRELLPPPTRGAAELGKGVLGKGPGHELVRQHRSGSIVNDENPNRGTHMYLKMVFRKDMKMGIISGTYEWSQYPLGSINLFLSQ